MAQKKTGNLNAIIVIKIMAPAMANGIMKKNANTNH